MLLQFWGDSDGLAGEQRRDPFGSPGALAGVVDAGKRLQGDRLGEVVGEGAAEIVPIAAHRERRGPDAAAEVEGEDLRPGITAELQRHQRQQYALARAGRPDDQRVADIADMEAEPERCRSFRSGEKQWRGLKMFISFRPCPHRRERHHVRQVERRDWRLADIGVDVARQVAGSQCLRSR